MHKTFLSIASFLGLLAVILGAFGTHGLEGKLDSRQESIYDTAVLYHFLHVFAIFAADYVRFRLRSTLSGYASYCFIFGILLFSGSLYFMACSHLIGIEIDSILGPITPLGGILLITGWGLMLWSVISNK